MVTTSAEMVYQDANMDKCRFYTHHFRLITNKIQSFPFLCDMDYLKQYIII